VAHGTVESAFPRLVKGIDTYIEPTREAPRQAGPPSAVIEGR
jgi:hypothetical protein